MSFRTGPSVFKDRVKVSFDYVPEKLLHREAQMQRLFSIFRPVGDSGIAANAFLYGSVGTGKTHTAKRFCEDFRVYANKQGRGLDFVHVNCRQKMGDDAVLLALLKHYDERFPDRGFSIPEKLGILRKNLEKRQLHFIVILDEVDALLRRPGGSELVYTFSRFGEEGGRGNVSLVLISQRQDSLDRLDAAALSTFRRTNAVEFPKYTTAELQDILEIRVQLAFHPGTMDGKIIDLIADVGSEFGDARYAIDILDRAGALADEEFAGEVGPDHVRAAKASVTPSDLQERLKDLDAPQKLVLLAIARKIRKRTYITTGEAEDAYAVVCEEFGEKPRGHTQLWKYIRDLDALGFIDAKVSGEGVVGKTTMISLPGIPAKLLADNIEATLKRRKRM
ncbi:MAG: AAA family ATPase [Candidatus Thermoplasmatota archaeon]